MNEIELMRVSKFLETHFCENLGFTFSFRGQPLNPMSVFHSSFMLGAAAFLVDMMKLNPSKDTRLIKSIEEDDQGMFMCRFNIGSVNGFRLVQIISVLEMLFNLNSTTDVSKLTQDQKMIDLSPIAEELAQDYMEPALEAISEE